ncbi:MAG: inositol monophosphatase family protein [Acidimicrobiales bacterium]
MPGPPTDELLDLAARLAGEAAALLVGTKGRRLSSIATKTSDTDMVTEMDRAAEQLIVEGLRAARPGDAILGEEGTADEGTTGVRWVVDPLDGTTNYLYGFPAFSVSIAAEVDGRSEVGVVVDPVHSETFAAVRGHGATSNGHPIRCTASARLATALIGTGFSYETGRRSRQAEVLTSVLPAVRDIRRAGAASVDLCWVACGRLDGFYEKGLQPWDFAAGALIAAEAGATTGDLHGGRPSTDCAMAAAPALFEPLRQLLVAAGA